MLIATNQLSILQLRINKFLVLGSYVLVQSFFKLLDINSLLLKLCVYTFCFSVKLLIDIYTELFLTLTTCFKSFIHFKQLSFKTLRQVSHFLGYINHFLLESSSFGLIFRHLFFYCIARQHHQLVCMISNHSGALKEFLLQVSNSVNHITTGIHHTLWDVSP